VLLQKECDMKRVIKIVSWIPIFIILTFFALISLMSLSEWWNVKISKEIDKYAWGPTNENSWFYETPSLYASVSLIEGILMMFLVVMTVIRILKSNMKFNYWLLACFSLFLIMLISSTIR
jgi:hypothetical protein